MADQTKTIAAHCIKCGGELRFDPVSEKLKCEFCDSLFTSEEVEQYLKEKEEKLAIKEAGLDWGKDSQGMRAYGCSTCGAELIMEENTVAMRCPYCGSQTIVPAQFEGAIRPDYIIPFKYTKQQAEEKYRSYYSKKKLLPGSFLKGNYVEEIQGVYVPFWLYDGTVSINAEYVASDTEENAGEKVINYYNVQRKGNIAFKNVPADASKRMPDDLMDTIEPYDYDGLKDFSIAYLPGFLAERFNITANFDRERAEKRVRETAEKKIRETVKHDNIEKKQEHLTVNFMDKKYVLFPVWYLTTNWNNKQWQFAMNGQTGEFKGDLPIDNTKKWIITLIAFLIPFILTKLYFGNWVLPVIFGLIAAFIASMICSGSMKPVVRAYGAGDYMDKDVNLTVATEQFFRAEKKPKASGNSKQTKP
ncbi:MAG: hypothetical protein IJM37_00220 [Lachnospiraceae bacterium]|nr:hypothetical protein [Lachnospiraceae bacterium]